ncbi:hypothetical protein BDD12DRAFT_817692 [Trichophaea hybrida]|nr:hypothetical protein BDD12DRAFT_817692 [Trichophaea hybrida]
MELIDFILSLLSFPIGYVSVRITSRMFRRATTQAHPSHPPSRMHIVGKLMALLLNRSQRVLYTSWIMSIYLGRYLVVSLLIVHVRTVEPTSF